MRASNPGGRFTTSYEIDSYTSGIQEDLQRPVGGSLPWWRFDDEETEVDDLYTVGSYDGGRRYRKPRALDFITARLYQGQTHQSDRGAYNADVLSLSVSRKDFEKVFPNVVPDVDNFLPDRAVFQNTIFRPTHFSLRGWVSDYYTIISVEMIEVKGEELVNDPQFEEMSD